MSPSQHKRRSVASCLACCPRAPPVARQPGAAQCAQPEQLAGLCRDVWSMASQWWMAVCNVHVMHLFKICSPRCRSSGRWELACCVQRISWQWWMTPVSPSAHMPQELSQSLWDWRKQKQKIIVLQQRRKVSVRVNFFGNSLSGAKWAWQESGWYKSCSAGASSGSSAPRPVPTWLRNSTWALPWCKVRFLMWKDTKRLPVCGICFIGQKLSWNNLKSENQYQIFIMVKVKYFTSLPLSSPDTFSCFLSCTHSIWPLLGPQEILLLYIAAQDGLKSLLSVQRRPLAPSLQCCCWDCEVSACFVFLPAPSCTTGIFLRRICCTIPPFQRIPAGQRGADTAGEQAVFLPSALPHPFSKKCSKMWIYKWFFCPSQCIKPIGCWQPTSLTRLSSG